MSIGGTGGAVAFFAHIGGFLAGRALIGLVQAPERALLWRKRQRLVGEVARFIWFVWFVLFIWLNETNQKNQIDPNPKTTRYSFI